MRSCSFMNPRYQRGRPDVGLDFGNTKLKCETTNSSSGFTTKAVPRKNAIEHLLMRRIPATVEVQQPVAPNHYLRPLLWHGANRKRPSEHGLDASTSFKSDTMYQRCEEGNLLPAGGASSTASIDAQLRTRLVNVRPRTESWCRIWNALAFRPAT